MPGVRRNQRDFYAGHGEVGGAGTGRLADYTVDGTTLQANAPRHSAVWRKNSARYKQSAIERIEDYFDQIQALAMPLKGTKNYHYGPDAQTHDKCSCCPVKSDCTWDEGNRSIQFTRDLEEWKQLMTTRMSRGKAKWPSRNRGAAIESILGLLRHNDGMPRSMPPKANSRSMLRSPISIFAIPTVCR